MKPLLRIVLIAALAVGSQVAATPAALASDSADKFAVQGCNLGNGVTHVVNIVFDNTHFTRDNPNVPSDLEQMPNLLNFMEHNGVLLSDEHTPLIAHTADDILTTLTGVYGDKHGQPVANDYGVFNTDGT